MARRQYYTPFAKVIATLLGAALCGLEAYLNSEYFARLEGWASPMVFIVAMATIGGAAALPLAERAHKAGHKTCLALTFLFMAIASLVITHVRLDDRRSNEVVLASSGDERVKLAREAYDAAKKTADAECGKRGPKCRTAEEAVTKARKDLSEKPAERGEERQTKQLGAVVLLYAFPLGQLLGGFALLAYGLSPRIREPKPETANSKKGRNTRKRKKSAPQQLEERSNFLRFRTRAR
jgi:hypothetical protein